MEIVITVALLAAVLAVLVLIFILSPTGSWMQNAVGWLALRWYRRRRGK